MKKLLLLLITFSFICISCKKESKHYILAVRTTFIQDVDGTAIDIYAVDDSSAYRKAFIEFLEFVDSSYKSDTTLNPFDFEIHLCGPDAKQVYDTELKLQNQQWKSEMIERYCSEDMKQKMERLLENDKYPGTAYYYWK